MRELRARYRGPAGRRGLALVNVLWVLTAASFLLTTRTEVNLTRKIIDNAKAVA